MKLHLMGLGTWVKFVADHKIPTQGADNTSFVDFDGERYFDIPLMGEGVDIVIENDAIVSKKEVQYFNL